MWNIPLTVRECSYHDYQVTYQEMSTKHHIHKVALGDFNICLQQQEKRSASRTFQIRTQL